MKAFKDLTLGELIEVTQAWAEHSPKFDIKFINSLADYFYDNGELSPKQEVALENIIQRWHVGDWYDKNPYVA